MYSGSPYFHSGGCGAWEIPLAHPCHCIFVMLRKSAGPAGNMMEENSVLLPVLCPLLSSREMKFVLPVWAVVCGDLGSGQFTYGRENIKMCS